MTTTKSHKFMSYTMESNGQITRNHRTLNIPDSELSDYTIRETLRGWAEREVYWRVMGDLSRVGIAPLSDAARKAMQEKGSFVSVP